MLDHNLKTITMLKHNQNIISETILKLPAGDSNFKEALENFNSDIDIDINTHGYRSDEFDVPHDISVVTIGCSHGFGHGIDTKDMFSGMFVDKLAKHTGKRVANWNLSFGARSNDYIARIVLAMPHTLKPDIILVAFTHFARREFFDINFDISNTIEGGYHHIAGRPNRGIHHDSFMAIASPHEDLLNFYKNYKIIEMLCELNGIQFLFTNSFGTRKDFGSSHDIKNELYVGEFEIIDHANDGCHPGPKSNQTIAQKFWEGYKNVYLD